MTITGVLGWLIVIVLIAIPSLIIIRYARMRGPVYTSTQAKSGFGGLLYLFIVGQVGWFLSSLWQTCYMTSELWFMLARNEQNFRDAFVAVVPSLAGLIIGAWVIWAVAVQRAPRALASAVIGLWLMGPGAAMLQSWYFGLQLTEASMTQIFGWCILWTLYFAISPRAALTYGTPRGKRIMEGN